ncbi:hypothetical protein BH23ACT12_BH23ACT12_03180 [soil metagenome]
MQASSDVLVEEEKTVTRPSVSHLHVVLLILIVFAGLARGLYWSATMEVFSPVDEAHHYAYIATLADEFRLPVMGRDLVPLEVLQIRKESPTLGARTVPRRADVADESWGAELEQYEALQPPLYYLLAAPVYRAASGLEPGERVFVLRAFTVLLAIVAVPLTWALARRIFPDLPGIWLAAPALLVVINGFNSNLATVTNDALVPVFGTMLLLAGVRFFQAPSAARAAVLGGVMGLCILTKLVLVAMIPVVGILFLLLVMPRHLGIVPTLRNGAICAVTAAVVVVPWFAYNVSTYDALTAAGNHYEIIGPFLAQSEMSLETLRNHALGTHAGLWNREVRPPLTREYGLIWGLALLTALVAALVGLVFGRRRREMLWVLWLSLAMPLSFATSEATFFLLFDGRGQTVGRYLYGALPATCIVLTAWPFMAGRWRLGWTLVAAVAAFALTVEASETRHYVSATYASGVLASGEVPIVDQSLNEGSAVTSSISANPPCPVTKMGFALVEGPPPILRVASGESLHHAKLVETISFDLLLLAEAPLLAVYEVPVPLTDPFLVAADGPLEVYAATTEQDGALSFVDGPGSPVARLYCEHPEAESVRFDQKYPPLHPVPMTLQLAHAWPTSWKVAGWVALLTAAIVALSDILRARRRPTE